MTHHLPESLSSNTTMQLGSLAKLAPGIQQSLTCLRGGGDCQWIITSWHNTGQQPLPSVQSSLDSPFPVTDSPLTVEGGSISKLGGIGHAAIKGYIHCDCSWKFGGKVSENRKLGYRL